MIRTTILRICLLILAVTSCGSEETTAGFSFTRDNGVSPCTVVFSNESSNATTFAWEFGDGKSSAEPNPTHTYYRSGTFTVTLTVTGETGTASASVEIIISTGGIEITGVPVFLGLDPFYKKYTDANGIPVISSGKVHEEALLRTRRIVIEMLSLRDDVRLMLIEKNARIGIIGATEVTTDMPEYAFLRNDPDTDWDERSRGLGGTIWVPLSTGAEENILCYSNDRYKPEDILIHEFAHAIHGMGIKFVETDFEERLNALYVNAINSGKWINTYAGSNFSEYWAEGVQDWYNVNTQSIPANGIHNHVNTRSELLQYDPGLHNLIAEYFNTTLTGSCHEY
jgi:PKD repeat protein